jgi:hypothetical protein
MRNRASQLNACDKAAKYAEVPLQDVEEELEVMPTDEPPGQDASSAFAESTGSLLETVLAKYKELILAGKLPTVSVSEWEKSVEESHRNTERVMRIARENLAKLENP